MFNECLYIWNIWTLLNLDKYNATLYKIFINEPLAQCAVSYALKVDLNERLWVVAYESLKNKGNAQLGNPKIGRGRLREGSITRVFRYKV